MSAELTDDERRTLSVLAYLFFRMGLGERAKRIYAAVAELSEADSADYRFAKAGVAAVDIDLGNAAEALAALKEILRGQTLATREAPLHLLKAQALWQLGRRDEARAERDEYLRLCGRTAAASGKPASRIEGAHQP